MAKANKAKKIIFIAKINRPNLNNTKINPKINKNSIMTFQLTHTKSTTYEIFYTRTCWITQI